MLHSVTQQVDDSPLAALLLQAGEKPAAHRGIPLQFQSLGRFRLGSGQKITEVYEIDTVLPVVIAGVAQQPAGAAVGLSREVTPFNR